MVVAAGSKPETQSYSSLIPSFSLAERDRRYALIRKEMAAQKIDVLVLPASVARWEQTLADSRYVTQIGGFGTESLAVFPMAGEVTAYLFNRAGFWKKHQNWVADLRDGHNHWAENVKERLTELGFSRGRIGISGLAGLTRSPDGIVPHATVEGIRQAFPQAEIVNATDLMRDVRGIKSEEELAAIARSASIAEAMVASVATLRPGATERDAFARMTAVQVEQGGDLPSMLLLGSGPGIRGGNFVPTMRKLASGDLVTGEVEGRYAGYSAQVVRPILLGRATPDYRAVLDVSIACLEEVIASLKAGSTLGSVIKLFDDSVARHGKGACTGSHPLMHARGLGDEYPAVLKPKDIEKQGDIRLAAGMVFVVKPRIARQDGITAQFGDTVVVGEKGGRRMGTAPLALEEVAWG